MSQATISLHAEEQFARTQSRLDPWRERWGADALGLLAVLAVVVVFSHQLLGPQVSVPGQIGYAISPWNAIGSEKINNHITTDVIFSVYPNRQFVNTQLQQGHFPLWDPYRETGKSVIGDANQNLFYPTTILLGWLSAGHALDIETFLHLLACAVGTYVLVRIWGGRPPGAVVGAIAFTFCCNLTVWQQYGKTVTAAAWLPWLVICFVLAQRGNRLLWLGVGGGIMGLVFLANNIEWTIYEALFLGCYAVLLGAPHVRRRQWRRMMTPLIDVAIIGIVGAGIGAIQIVPFLESAMLSPRTGVKGYAYIFSFAAPHAQLLTLLAPNFFGTPTVANSDWGPGAGGFYPEWTIFFGVFPLIIALCAPLWRRSRLTWFLWAFSLIMASFIFGSPTLHILAHLPAFDVFKPSRMSYLLCFAGAVLCGLVFDALFTDRHRWRPLLVIGCVALIGQDIVQFALDHYRDVFPKVSTPTYESVRWVTLVVLGGILIFALAMLPWWSARALAQGALVLLIVADIAHFSIPYNAGTIDEQRILPLPTVIAALPRSVAPPRVVAIQQPNDASLLTPNTLNLYGVSDLSTLGSLMPQSYLDYIGHIEHRDLTYSTTIVVHNAASPLLDLASTEYFLSNTPLDTAGKRLELVTVAQYVYLYRNLRAAPRAFIVTNVKPVASEGDVWGTLDAPTFAPCSVAVIETTKPPQATGSDQSGCVGTATITHYEPNRVALHAETPADGLLVFTDAYYPGWYVTVDGKSAPIYKTDDEFRGVPITAGVHDVQFVYRPPSLIVGGVMSGMSLLCAITLVALGFGSHLFARRRKAATRRSSPPGRAPAA